MTESLHPQRYAEDSRTEFNCTRW